ncbi:MAG: sulfatase [Bryobacterales bacterium]
MLAALKAVWPAALLLCFSHLTPGALAQPPARNQPNIVVILADDLGYGELGCQGNPEIPTPSIDSIARRGVRFTNGYVSAPNCSPSRAGLLTGRYQTRFGHEFNPIGARNVEPGVGLPLRETSFVERLHDVGYATALVGKWHLGGTAPFHPNRRGFDYFYGFLHEGHFFVPAPWEGVTTMLRRKSLPGGERGRAHLGSVIYSTHMGHDEPPYDADNPMLRGGQPVAEQEYLTDAITREAVDFVRRSAEQPFFLLVSYNAVHSPLQGADRYMQRFESIPDIHRRIFAAMLANLDEGVGKILAALRGQGLEENTLLFFLSDNGGPTRELTSSNKPLRGGKSDVYEGGLRVPFLVQWPARLPQGAEEHRPVISLDIAATALNVAGAGEQAALDGVSLTPYLTDENSGRPHEELFWRQGQRIAVRVHDWKLLRNSRTDSEAWELYDLSSDPGETKNLIAEQAQRAASLKSVLERLDREMVRPAF